MAAAAARFLAGDASGRPAREEPRTERFFDRPFPFLVRYEDVLVPVDLALGVGPAPGDGARERAAVEAEARAWRN